MRMEYPQDAEVYRHVSWFFLLMRASSILKQTQIILLVANPIMSTCSLVQSPFLDHQNRSKRLNKNTHVRLQSHVLSSFSPIRSGSYGVYPIFTHTSVTLTLEEFTRYDKHWPPAPRPLDILFLPMGDFLGHGADYHKLVGIEKEGFPWGDMYIYLHIGVSWNRGYPKNRWFVRQQPTKMEDDWGYPYLRKPLYI